MKIFSVIKNFITEKLVRSVGGRWLAVGVTTVTGYLIGLLQGSPVQVLSPEELGTLQDLVSKLFHGYGEFLLGAVIALDFFTAKKLPDMPKIPEK